MQACMATSATTRMVGWAIESIRNVTIGRKRAGQDERMTACGGRAGGDKRERLLSLARKWCRLRRCTRAGEGERKKEKGSKNGEGTGQRRNAKEHGLIWEDRASAASAVAARPVTRKTAENSSAMRNLEEGDAGQAHGDRQGEPGQVGRSAIRAEGMHLGLLVHRDNRGEGQYGRDGGRR